MQTALHIEQYTTARDFCHSLKHGLKRISMPWVDLFAENAVVEFSYASIEFRQTMQ